MLLARDDEPIIAQCTPAGPGAIALLRISGVQIRSLLEPIVRLASGKKIASLASHTVHYGSILDSSGCSIDNVLFIIMDGPRTFTGQDVVEITCHNNPFLIDAIITQVIKQGARLAQEGEFTKRAYLNGKIDLVQAEAVNELIHANTQLALKQSLAQLEGSFSHWIGQLEKELIRAFAWCQASFEFLDDEAEFGQEIKQHIEFIIREIEKLKKTFTMQQQIRQGIRIAFIGSVNAGKSSAFNALLNQPRSIVTAIAGTTRDVVEAGMYKNGNYWTLIDTAGLRQTDNIIEQEGIRRSFQEAQKADIIILVFDGSRLLTPEEQAIYQEIVQKYSAKTIVLHNKADLPLCIEHPLSGSANIKFSSVEHTTCDPLEQLIEEKINQLMCTIESPFLLNTRQYTLMISLENKLNDILQMFDTSIQFELLAYHLHDALEVTSELSGKTASEAGLDAVFKEFCVGK